MTEAEAKRLNENKLTELVDEFKGGNSDAFTGIYDLTKNQLYAYALVLKKNQDAALDLLQETYVKIYRSIDQLNNSDKFLSWAKTILHNSAFSDSNSIFNKKNSERWWLRSPGKAQTEAVVFRPVGDLDIEGFHVSSADNYIRPALWINNTP